MDTAGSFRDNKVTKSQITPEDHTIVLVSDHLKWEFDYTKGLSLMMVQGGSSKKSEEHTNNLHRPQLFFFADI